MEYKVVSITKDLYDLNHTEEIAKMIEKLENKVEEFLKDGYEVRSDMKIKTIGADRLFVIIAQPLVRIH